MNTAKKITLALATQTEIHGKKADRQNGNRSKRPLKKRPFLRVRSMGRGMPFVPRTARRHRRRVARGVRRARAREARALRPQSGRIFGTKSRKRKPVLTKFFAQIFLKYLPVVGFFFAGASRPQKRRIYNFLIRYLFCGLVARSAKKTKSI